MTPMAIQNPRETVFAFCDVVAMSFLCPRQVHILLGQAHILRYDLKTARWWFQVSNIRGEDSHFGVETRNHQLVLRGFALRWPLVVMIDS